MSTTTSRLALVQPAGADPPSILRTSADSNATTLDNAAIYQPTTTLVLRPAANTVPAGSLHKTSDTGLLAFGDGVTWTPFGPLVVVSAPSNVTAAAGQTIFASAGVTVTLPTAAVGTVVQVSASNTVTGASPVLVSSGSANIFGGGVSTSGVSSFPLGTGSASVTLAAAAGNWQIVAGQQDSGWVALTLAAGITQNETYVASARLRGDTVQLKGGVQNPTGSPIANAFTIAAGLRPSAAVNLGWAGLLITTAGQPSSTLGAGLAFPLDGLSYTLS